MMGIEDRIPAATTHQLRVMAHFAWLDDDRAAIILIEDELNRRAEDNDGEEDDE